MTHQTLQLSIHSLFFLITCITLRLTETDAIGDLNNVLPRGSSLSVEHDSDFLLSPNQTFTCGFHSLGGNSYWFSIWFTKSKDKTVVWTANRNMPVNGRGSKLTLRQNGALVLTDVDGTVAWESNTTSTAAASAELLETGNLVIKDPNNEILWQSFDYPTDTLLPNQHLTKITRLVSVLERGAYYSGYFNLFFDNDNVLRLIYDGPDISSLYWPNPDLDVFQNGRSNYNSSRVAIFNERGSFLSSDRFQFNASDYGIGIKRRLTMDYDGNLRLYSLNESTGSWSMSWRAFAGLCRIHGICGRNGICVNTPEPKCTCPPGYKRVDSRNWQKGCQKRFKSTCSNNKFVELLHTDYYGFDLVYQENSSFEDCRKSCLESCSCQAFSYRITGERLCFAKSELFNGFQSLDFQGSIYLKLPNSFDVLETPRLKGINLSCSLNASRILVGSPSMYDTSGKRVKWAYFYWFASVIGGIEVLFAMVGLWTLFRRRGGPASIEDGYRALTSQFRRFSYAELKDATNNFREEIGRGASSSVYKGVLGDGRVVAVKRLGDVYHGEEVFWAEVSTVGQIYHMNLVRMWGFCCEGRHRILVYEYVENQSLDGHLFSAMSLGWKDRFRVALGTAKGLAYLHHECLEWVIHCDVKPENILLDGELEPKITDFGLAKLLQRDSANSNFSRIRGTKGYMAPEWTSNLPITAKVDVYSYGVMILEMVRGFRMLGLVANENKEQEAELTAFVREMRVTIQREDDSWIEEIVDPRLRGNYSRKQVRKLVEIGLSCVEEDRNNRPTMGSIVDGLLQLETNNAEFGETSAKDESHSS